MSSVGSQVESPLWENLEGLAMGSVPRLFFHQALNVIRQSLIVIMAFGFLLSRASVYTFFGVAIVSF